MLRGFLSRFLILQISLILLPCVVAATVASVEADDGSGRVIFWTCVAFLISASACGLGGFFLFRSHVRETAKVLTDAVPAAKPEYPDDETIIDDIALTFHQLMDEASEKQAQLLTIISSMSDGLIATDFQQRILLTNDAAAELMAFRTLESKGKQLWEVVPIEAVLKAVTDVSLTGQQKTVSIGPVEGKHLEVTVSRLPLRPAGFVIVAHDVSEAMRYEELRKEFVANVSHELRTPLSVIKGYVETLADGALDDRPRAIQYLGTVGKHTEHLSNLVNDLLSLSRLDSNSTIPNQRPVYLGRVANKVSELLTPTANKKGHKLLVQIAEGMHPVIGNPEYLERAVLNLVDNSIKYTKENGIIRLVVRGEKDSSIVEVVDNGIGIGADDLPRIFERFYRVDRSRSRDMGGTGLGLSIVKHIVATHGGTVEVESVPGAGSTFRLRFPASKEPGTGQTDINGAAA